MDKKTNEQKFYGGGDISKNGCHTDTLNAIAFSKQANLVVAAEIGSPAKINFWDLNHSMFLGTIILPKELK